MGLELWDLSCGKTSTARSWSESEAENHTQRHSLWSGQIPAALACAGEETEAEGKAGLACGLESSRSFLK